MTDSIESISLAAARLALDASSLRQQAIASNIANANVSGYATQRVSFEEQLSDARRVLADNGRLDASALLDVKAQVETGAVRSSVSTQVQLDAEVAALSLNALHYQALVKGLSRHFGILEMAAADGRK